MESGKRHRIITRKMIGEKIKLRVIVLKMIFLGRKYEERKTIEDVFPKSTVRVLDFKPEFSFK